jgi:hypothetical protein
VASEISMGTASKIWLFPTNSQTQSDPLGRWLGGFTGSTEVGVSSFPVSVAVEISMGTASRIGYRRASCNTVSIRLGDGLADLAAQRKSAWALLILLP